MLDPDVLVSPILSLDSLLIAGDDKVLNIYFHALFGPTEIGAGSLYPQTITTLEFPDTLIDHAKWQFLQISSKVDVSFEITSDPSIADISFYYDSEIVLDDSSGITFGVAISNGLSSSRRQWIEIFLNGPELDVATPDFVSYVFNHELLHALGLEHTFDDSDGDFYISTDPYLGATPEDTVMSYRPPDSGIYPTDLSPSDYNALISIWGAAQVAPVSASSEQPVFRLYNSYTGNHLFTTNQFEVDLLTGSSHDFQFINEGIAYTVGSGAEQNLYRFYHTLTDRHFYSANNTERDLLIADDTFGYLYEGIAFQVFIEPNANTFATPVYRFFDPSNNTHLYTASDYEKNIWESNSLGWINEGIAWYA